MRSSLVSKADRQQAKEICANYINIQELCPRSRLISILSEGGICSMKQIRGSNGKMEQWV
jgi:hypothetical protein